MAKNDVQRKIDRPKARSGSASVSIGSGGTVDLSPYMLLDGSVAMTGSLNMGNFSIINVSLVDGIDVPAHVADVNAHHSKLHDLDSTLDHSGTLSWAKVNKTGSNITDIVTRLHNSLQSIGPNDHHNQVHGIVSSDHTVAGSALDVVGLSGTNTLAVLTPSFAPGATAKVLRSDSDGSLTIQKLIGVSFVKSSAYIEATTYVSAPSYVYTPSLQHVNSITIQPTVDIVLTPGSNLVKLSNGKAFRTESFGSGFAGHGFQLDQGITTAGITTLQLDDLFVRGRMHVYELLIQQIRATNGSVFVSSVAKIKTVTNLGGGYYTLTTDPGSGGTSDEAHGFLVGDLIRAQRTKWDGSSFAGVYQSNMQVTSVTNLHNFTAQFISGDAPAPGYEFVRIGSATNSNRRGSIYLTSDDASAPFIDILNDVDSFSDWNTAAVSKMRIGKLDGITGEINEYGFIAGAGGYSDSVKYIKASNYGIRLNNVDLKLWSSGVQRVNINSTGTEIWIRDASGDAKLSWNGTTLSIAGAITVTSGSSGFANLSDRPLVAGGENLFLNGSFELDSNSDGFSDSWTLYNNSPGTEPHSYSRTTGRKSGTYCQIISWTGANTTSKGVIQQQIGGKKAGVWYTISWWLFQNTNIALTPDTHFNVHPVSKEWLVNPTPALNTWQFFAQRCKWSVDTADPWHLSTGYGGGQTGWVAFDEVMVHEGDMIQAYSASFLDGFTFAGYVKNPVTGGFITSDVPPATGFNITSVNTGYWNGSAWKVFFDNAGNFYFGGNSGASLRWDGSKLGGYNSSGTQQWWAGSATGQLVAGQGFVTLDTNGVTIYRNTWTSTTGTPEPVYGTLPNTAPDLHTVLDLRDTGDYAWTHSVPPVFSLPYNNNTILRIYGSSKHLIPQYETDWAHYYDGVIEIPTPTVPYSHGDIAKRLYFKGMDSTYMDGNLRLYGNLDMSGSQIAVSAIGISGGGGSIVHYDRDGDGQIWVEYHSAGILRFWNPTYGDRLTLDQNGHLIHYGDAYNSGYLQVVGGFYNNAGWFRSDNTITFQLWNGTPNSIDFNWATIRGSINSPDNDWYIYRNSAARIGLFSWGTYIYDHLTISGVFSGVEQTGTINSPASGWKMYEVYDSGYLKMAIRFASGRTKFFATDN